MTKSTDNVPLVSLTTHDHVALYYVDLGSRLDLGLLDEDCYVHSQFQDPAEDGWYYYMTIYVPLCMLVICSWMAFLLDRKYRYSVCLFSHKNYIIDNISLYGWREAQNHDQGASNYFIVQ